MADPTAEETDSGLQAERTTMAWQRTALGVAAVSALLLHHAEGRVGLSMPGGAGLLAALALLLGAEGRDLRAQRGEAAGCSPMGQAFVRAVALGTMVLAVAAVAVVLRAEE